MSGLPQRRRGVASVVGRLLAGTILLPILPFVSAFLWGAGRTVVVVGLLVTVAAYLVFFFHAIGWGALGVATAAMWSLAGSLVTAWRHRARKH